MIQTGLVSVTFRKLSPGEILDLVVKAGLQGIEWGGDIHVPHGDVKRAREVGRMTVDAGLKVVAYGSYYYVGCNDQKIDLFKRVLNTAEELMAPTIRVWAGNLGSLDADEDWWKRIIDETFYISETAKKSGINISYEYHSHTLTDTGDTTVRLLNSLDGCNVASYWQPSAVLGLDQQIMDLKKIIPWLGNIHVFWWNDNERLPLSVGISMWKKYMELIINAKGNRFCMIEFVKNDDPEQFLIDADVLKQIIM